MDQPVSRFREIIASSSGLGRTPVAAEEGKRRAHSCTAVTPCGGLAAELPSLDHGIVVVPSAAGTVPRIADLSECVDSFVNIPKAPSDRSPDPMSLS